MFHEGCYDAEQRAQRGLGRDTSFIPDSHGHLGPALIGPSCVGKAVSTYRLSSVGVDPEGGIEG